MQRKLAGFLLVLGGILICVVASKGGLSTTGQTMPSLKAEAASVVFAHGAGGGSSSSKEIQNEIELFRHAVLKKDMNGIARYYWNSPDLVVFDVVPPLSYVGWEESFRKDWEGFFEQFKTITVYDWSDVKIEAQGDMAWMHAFIHFVGQFSKDGTTLDMIARDTAIFERKNGKWAVVHDHGSLPIDFETKMATLNAPPR
jgi:ketosteroid isomerase-like protein